MKAYFVNTETDEVYELPDKHRKQLESIYPNWVLFDDEKNPGELQCVLCFFQTKGKLVAHSRLRNVFVGLAGTE